MGVRIVPAEEGIGEAIERLHAGQLVAFPTETVYGLGADARNADAVAQIFALKGRPATNPLIVHVASEVEARKLTNDWPQTAEKLAGSFWPGPLTLVLPTDTGFLIPSIVTAGGDTVGLRVPAHPVALRLLRESGLAIAAPSANRSEEVSPTTAQHVAESLGLFADDLLILDGGPCQVGIESMVIDVAADPPRILRPGMLSPGQLEGIGLFFKSPLLEKTPEDKPARSPGQRARHYAPRVPMVIVPVGQELEWGNVLQDGFLLLSSFSDFPNAIRMPGNAPEYAARLYSALRELDSAGVRQIVVVDPPHEPEWDAIHDRLRRAATPKSESENG